MNQSIDAKFRMQRQGFCLDVDLRLPPNGVTVVFGPSGSGKSTLLRCLAGLERPVDGRMVVHGELWQGDGVWVPPHRRSIGVVFQTPGLFAHLTVRGNLEFGRKRLPAAMRPDLAPIVGLLGIERLLERRIDGLSGGEAQRVGIARALALAPRLLLMDEPLSSLDQARKREILPFLERLRDESGIPIVYVTHSTDEVARLSDHLVVLQEGRVVVEGAFQELQGRLDLPRRIGDDARIVLDAVVGAVDEKWHLARMDFSGGSLWARDRGLPVGRRTRIQVLARDVSLALEPPGRSSIQNVLPGNVGALGEDEHPGLVLVRVDLGGGVLLARLTRRAVAEMGIESGQRVWVQVKTVALAE